MPTRKPRRRPVAKRKLPVSLTDWERTVLGTRLLGIQKSPRRTAVLRELTSALSRLATELGNAPNVRLRSDLIAHYEPLAKDALRLRKRVESTSPEVIGLATTLKLVDFERLEAALTELDEFGAWLRKEPSKKGGERRAFEKVVRHTTQMGLEAWYAQHCQVPASDRKKGGAARFAKTAFKAIDRAIAQAAKKRSHTGTN